MKYEITAVQNGRTNPLVGLEDAGDLESIQQAFADIIKYCHQYEGCAFAVRIDDPYFMYCAQTKTTVDIRPAR